MNSKPSRITHIVFVALAALTLAITSVAAPQPTFGDVYVSCGNSCDDPTGG